MPMKAATRLALVAALLAAAGWIWWRHAPDSLPAFVRDHVPRSPVANPPLYKWKDARGQWQVTDRPPPDR
ncbi:MAG TPA: hypothetical protein PLI00_03670, partial [Pseudomonadota bacterium]|nr:hypothetical protein [Pseudomonadota bacterium]